MIRGIDGILLSSQNAKKLADFYKTKVGLKLTNEFEIDEKSNGFEFGMKSGGSFVIMDHSKVKGANKQPERFLINFEVDDLEKEFERLVKAGVKKIADIYHVENYGLVSTFEDPDGNYFQLVQVRES